MNIRRPLFDKPFLVIAPMALVNKIDKELQPGVGNTHIPKTVALGIVAGGTAQGKGLPFGEHLLQQFFHTPQVLEWLFYGSE